MVVKAQSKGLMREKMPKIAIAGGNGMGASGVVGRVE